MDLSDDSSRGSTSKSAAKKSRNGKDKAIKATASKKKAVTAEHIEQFCAVTGEVVVLFIVPSWVVCVLYFVICF